ncbi:MAG: sensor histidine kinase [Candidatus Aminicenantes bacterium]|nr:sensor histidine kinase [Candidatus Aminicenantes bacterium]
MEDLSLHILDIAENSIAADADMIEIHLIEEIKKDRLFLEIKDNGRGMDQETAKKAVNPFYTTRTTRRFGFGIPFLAESAKAADGDFSIVSKENVGTKITATFKHSHMDRKPIGNIGETLTTLVMGNPEVDILFIHKMNSYNFTFDTRKIKNKLKETPINSPEGIKLLREDLKRYKSHI